MPFVLKNKWAHTFQGRLALHHIALVSLALLIAFAISFLTLRSFINSDNQLHLKMILQQAQNDYLGESTSNDHQQLPEDLLQKIRIQFPELHIGNIEKEKFKEDDVYEVTGSTGSEQLEIMIKPNGELWVLSRESNTLLFSSLKKTTYQTPSTQIDYTLFSPTGTPLGGPAKTLPNPIRNHFKTPPDDLSQPFIKKEPNHWIGAIQLYDNNILYIEYHATDLARLSKLWIAFFALLALFFIPLSAWIGFYISKRALAGINRLTDAVTSVKKGDLKQRVQITTDGSEIENLANNFNEMIEQIEILIFEMQEVTTNIAHDLRTPIARIRGMIETLNWNETTSDQKKEVIAKCIEECDRTIPLIENIMQLSLAESGSLPLHKEKIDLCAEVRTAHEIFSSMASDKQIHFTCTLPDTPLTLFGDRSAFQRIISNLLDNAFKFTPNKGTVQIALTTTKNQGILTITDSGPGIPKKDLDRVFERFYRGDQSRNQPGYGLGLPLVRAFAKTFNASVHINPNTSKGCQILLTF